MKISNQLTLHSDHIPCAGGKCISSKSPWVTAINHQIAAKNSQERTKLNANTISVHRHCESTSVVKMSCRNRILRREIFFCITLQSLKKNKEPKNDVYSYLNEIAVDFIS